jgi:hypothetical protein
LLILLDLLPMLEALILPEVSYFIRHDAENQNYPNHCSLTAGKRESIKIIFFFSILARLDGQPSAPASTAPLPQQAMLTPQRSCLWHATPFVCWVSPRHKNKKPHHRARP